MKHSFLLSVWSSILSVCWMTPLLAEMASANLHQVLCCEFVGIAEGAWSLQSLPCCLAGEVMIPPRISQWLCDSCWSRGSLSHSLGCGFPFPCCTQQACTIPSHAPWQAGGGGTNPTWNKVDFSPCYFPGLSARRKTPAVLSSHQTSQCMSVKVSKASPAHSRNNRPSV